jgi:hypothetical protein
MKTYKTNHLIFINVKTPERKKAFISTYNRSSNQENYRIYEHTHDINSLQDLLELKGIILKQKEKAIFFLTGESNEVLNSIIVREILAECPSTPYKIIS